MDNQTKLISNILKNYPNKPHHQIGDFGLKGRSKIYAILTTLIHILFQNSLGEKKSKTAYKLWCCKKKLIHFATHILILSNKSPKEAKFEAKKITNNLINELPAIQQALIEDIKSAYEGDPAAYSLQEIILSYPFIQAIATHRIAHQLYKDQLPIIPRIMSEHAHSHTGIDIHPGATIAPGIFIDHGTGVVIGETTTIGKNVKIYQGVTLGALSPFDKEGNPLRGNKRHPDIQDDVIIYANATILGGKTVIGKGAIVGGNCWVTKSVEPSAIVYHVNEVRYAQKKESKQ